jgi:hypothetical protein
VAQAVVVALDVSGDPAEQDKRIQPASEILVAQRVDGFVGRAQRFMGGLNRDPRL